MAGNIYEEIKLNEYDCPFICPGYKKADVKEQKPARLLQNDCTAAIRDEVEAWDYVPGMIVPPKRTPRSPGDPPPWLPIPHDTTSGDFLTMSPIDPWAPGHMDWSPQAGSTGLRPVVDRYSLTRYSTGQWRRHNEHLLAAHPTQQGKNKTNECRQIMDTTFNALKQKEDHSNKMLDKRIKDLAHWKKEVERAHKGIADELEALECNRMRLKTSSRILMIPEAISRECLELRMHRLEPDQVRDNAEQELIREVALVGEIRRVFNETLSKVEKQILDDRAAKAAIELDWSDKLEALNQDKLNRSLNPDSTLLLKHPGVDRFVENSCSLEYWLHYCQECINNCDETRQRSAKLRDHLMTAIVEGGHDLKKQFDRTNMALQEAIDAQEGLCNALEKTLKDNLRQIVDTEKLIDELKERMRQLNNKCKLGMTRLHNRNYERHNVENCRDEAQYALLDEIKLAKEKQGAFTDKLREIEGLRSQLMKFRGDLELQIAGKRKCLNIDRDRMGMIRAHIPTPEEFAAE